MSVSSFIFFACSWQSFDMLVERCQPLVESLPITPSTEARVFGRPKKCHLKRRMLDAYEIIAVGVKYLVSVAEAKDLASQFGMTKAHYSQVVLFALEVLVKVLANDNLAQVCWDMTEEVMAYHKKRTSIFRDCPGFVAFIDGKLVPTLNHGDNLMQNREYNGWKADVFRKCVFVWDTDGRCVDAAVNLPGTFHELKASLWCVVYTNIKKLPEGCCVCADLAFGTTNELDDRIIKSEHNAYYLDELSVVKRNDVSKRDAQLTALRQCSEWGNNNLVSVSRRLKTKLGTSSTKRGLVMWAALLLHNWRLSTMNLSQTKV